MRTTIVIDDKLIKEAMRASGLKTKRAVVEEGLKLLVQVKELAQIRHLKGRVKWQGNLDEMRRGRDFGDQA